MSVYDQAAAAALQRLHQGVRQSFFPVEFRHPGGAGDLLESSFITREMGALRVTEGTASSSFPLEGELTRRQIAREYPDEFVLLISRKGHVQHTQFGRSDVTKPGKMILIHARAPYQVHSDTNISSLLINIPGALLRSAVGSPEEYCTIAMDSGHGLNALFCDFMHSIWHKLDELSEPQRFFLSKQFLDFLVAALKSMKAKRIASHRSSEDQHFDEALRFIEANLANYSLCAEQVARSLHLSPSRLHAIARTKNISIGRLILDLRLERCLMSLADARCEHRSIAAIAYDWGFKSNSHFSEVFKDKFGISPREFRKQKSRHE